MEKPVHSTASDQITIVCLVFYSNTYYNEFGWEGYTNQHFTGDLECDVCILSLLKTKMVATCACKHIKVRQTCVQMEQVFTSQTRSLCDIYMFLHSQHFTTDSQDTNKIRTAYDKLKRKLTPLDSPISGASHSPSSSGSQSSGFTPLGSGTNSGSSSSQSSGF